MNSSPSTKDDVPPSVDGRASDQRPAGGGSDVPKASWVELIATVLLALAAVATAWSGYQASRWHGEQAIAFSRANASRLESNDYVLGVVLFSVALFFAGISSRLGAPRAVILGVGCAVLLGTIAWMATLPIRLST